MRIAVSGAHRVGKSTLVAELVEALPGYQGFAEPYELMEEEGYAFAAEPSVDDYLAQLEVSLRLIGEGEDNAIYDRCPLDFLGYLRAHPDSEAFEADEWLPQVRQALATLDLIVFVGIEDRVRVALNSSEDRRLREEVDGVLRALILDDGWALGHEALEVHGSTRDRVRGVMEWMAARQN